MLLSNTKLACIDANWIAQFCCILWSCCRLFSFEMETFHQIKHGLCTLQVVVLYLSVFLLISFCSDDCFWIYTGGPEKWTPIFCFCDVGNIKYARKTVVLLVEKKHWSPVLYHSLARNSFNIFLALTLFSQDNNYNFITFTYFTSQVWPHTKNS